MNETLVMVLRWLHILAGFGAFFIAPIPLTTAKGGRTHRRWGKIYFWLMAVVASTAIVLAIWRPVVLLALVAVFSFYFAFRGYRVLGRKRPDHGQGPKALDWIGALVALAGSFGLIVLGIWRPTPVWQQLGVVAVVFGAVGAGIAGYDLRQFTHPPRDKSFWWYSHMSGMIGSYIAAVSAFSVVNFSFLPTVIRWLWPTAIGLPLLFYWIRAYRKKFSARVSPSPAD